MFQKLIESIIPGNTEVESKPGNPDVDLG